MQDWLTVRQVYREVSLVLDCDRIYPLTSIRVTNITALVITKCVFRKTVRNSTRLTIFRHKFTQNQSIRADIF